MSLACGCRAGGQYNLAAAAVPVAMRMSLSVLGVLLTGGGWGLGLMAVCVRGRASNLPGWEHCPNRDREVGPKGIGQIGVR